mmetsp:Transcript_11399/g.17130  ORF Transcript_11399/g.17130 Transcript_11399/m.17130 type:complete len:275 (-) Transcript_11399:1172-1996(-)
MMLMMMLASIVVTLFARATTTIVLTFLHIAAPTGGNISNGIVYGHMMIPHQALVLMKQIATHLTILTSHSKHVLHNTPLTLRLGHQIRTRFQKGGIGDMIWWSVLITVLQIIEGSKGNAQRRLFICVYNVVSTIIAIVVVRVRGGHCGKCRRINDCSITKHVGPTSLIASEFIALLHPHQYIPSTRGLVPVLALGPGIQHCSVGLHIGLHLQDHIAMEITNALRHTIQNGLCTLRSILLHTLGPGIHDAGVGLDVGLQVLALALGHEVIPFHPL